MTELTKKAMNDQLDRLMRPEGPRRPGFHRALFDGNGASWLLAVPVVLLAILLAVPLGFLVELVLTEDGFGKAMDDPFFVDSVVRTLVMAATVALLTLAFGTFYALAISLAPRVLSHCSACSGPRCWSGPTAGCSCTCRKGRSTTF